MSDASVTFLWAILPRLLNGVLWTLSLSFIAAATAFLLGFLIAFLIRTDLPFLKYPLIGFVEFMRGTPFIVQIFMLYYVAPLYGLTLDAFFVGVVGLSLYGAAYFSEIFRGALKAVPLGQIEAAEILGLSKIRIFIRIQSPQMIRTAFPAIINQIISLVKESSVLSIITIPELTAATTKIVNETFRFAEPYLAMAVLYWIIVEALSRVGRIIEIRLKNGDGREHERKAERRRRYRRRREKFRSSGSS